MLWKWVTVDCGRYTQDGSRPNASDIVLEPGGYGESAPSEFAQL